MSPRWDLKREGLLRRRDLGRAFLAACGEPGMMVRKGGERETGRPVEGRLVGLEQRKARGSWVQGGGWARLIGAQGAIVKGLCFSKDQSETSVRSFFFFFF